MKTPNKLGQIFAHTYFLFIKELPGKYILMVLFSLFPALVSPARVYLEKLIFDEVECVASGTPIGVEIYQFLIIFVLIQLLYVVVYPVFRSHVNYFGSEFETILQNQMNRKTAKIPLIKYESNELFTSIELASSASRELRFMVMMFSSEILLYFFQFVSISTILFSFHPALIILSVLSIIPDLFAKYINSINKNKIVADAQKILRKKKYYENILTAPQNAKESRVHHTNAFFTNLWDEQQKAFFQENWKIIVKNSWINVISQTVNIATTAAVYMLSIYLALRGEITIGVFGASIGAVFTLKSNFGRICNLAMFSFECGLKGKYYYNVLSSEERPTGFSTPVSPKNGISISNVDFTYNDNKKVLKNISFNIHSGEKVAIVGKNGSGKTTLAKIILNLYSPSTGIICYGGEDVREYSEQAVYHDTSAVFQDFGKYNLNIKENVLLGDSSHIDMNRICKVLEESFFDISLYPVEQSLGVAFGGVDLSLGNWQKIALARGLYRKHSLIVFDEPTASIDPISESMILEKMLSHHSEIVIVITHRLSTTKLVDKIIVLDNGNIVGVGSHDELINSNSVYQELWSSQAKWYIDPNKS